jgi:general secretion pathway protein M
MVQLLQRFQGLTQRERVVLGIGGISALLIVVYSFVWQPWQEELNRLRIQVPIKKETLAWMHQQKSLVNPLIKKANQKTKSSDKPLLTVVERSAKQSKMDVYIRRMSPGEDGQVKLWLTDADFEQWLTWLEKLRKAGVEVESASINQTGNNRVTIRVTLKS